MNLFEIPIERFLADTPLSCDTFIFLRLNNKSIRIGYAGESLAADMLAKLRAKGHTHLRISTEAAPDPATFAIHLDAPNDTEEQPNLSPQSTPLAPEPEAVAHLSSAAPEPTGEIMVKGSPAEPEGEILVKGAAVNEAEGETLVKGSLPEKEEEIKVKGQPQEAGEEVVSRFSVDATAEEDTALVKGGKTSNDPHLTLVKGSSTTDDNTEVRISSSPTQKEKIERIRASARPEDDTVTTFSAEKSATPAALRLSQRLSQAGEGRDTEVMRFRQEKEEVIAELKTVVLSSKISEKIVELSAQAKQTEEPSLRSSLRGQVRDLKANLEKLDFGEEIEETEEINAHREIAELRDQLESEGADPVKAITKHLAHQTQVKDLAISAAEEQEEEELTLSRSATSRDLPATVSRLAAYLGHSLGYTDVEFLADLACGVVLHFAKKEGESLNESELPALAKLIITPNESFDSILEDSLDIVTFLDAYIDDRECDRSQKDLVKKIFDRTVRGFAGKDESPSPYSLSKWSSFLERGPTMDSHSIVTRAAAKGVKSARSSIV